MLGPFLDRSRPNNSRSMRSNRRQFHEFSYFITKHFREITVKIHTRIIRNRINKIQDRHMSFDKMNERSF